MTIAKAYVAGMPILNVFHLTHLLFQMKCCGVNSSSDWKGFKSEGNSVPDSCCVNVTTDCGIGAMTDADKVHQKVTASI